MKELVDMYKIQLDWLCPCTRTHALLPNAYQSERNLIVESCALHYRRLQQLEKEYETLRENDPAELQKAVSLTQVGRWSRLIRLPFYYNLNCRDRYRATAPIPPTMPARQSVLVALS